MEQLWESILYENFIFSFRNCEEIKSYLHLEEYCCNLLWSTKNETMNLVNYFTRKIKPGDTDFPITVQDSEPEIGSKMSSINQQLQLKLDSYFETSVNKDVIEQWRNRFTKYLEDACTDAKSKILESMYRHANLKSKIHSNKFRFEDFIMNDLEKTAQDLKLRHREMNGAEIDSIFEEKWKQSFSTFFSFLNKEEAHEMVFQAIDTELRSMFHQHNELLMVEKGNTNFNSKDKTFDNYLDVLEYDRYDKTHSIMTKLRDSFGIDICHEYSCLKFIQDNCSAIFEKVKQFVRELDGGDFQIGYATQVMQIIKECFNDVEEKRKTTRIHILNTITNSTRSIHRQLCSQ